MVELAREKPRFGYRRLHVLLGRSGEHVNHKRVDQVYREARLMIRWKCGKAASFRRFPKHRAECKHTYRSRKAPPLMWTHRFLFDKDCDNRHTKFGNRFRGAK